MYPGAPRSLRACLRSPEKREKIPPVMVDFHCFEFPFNLIGKFTWLF